MAVKNELEIKLKRTGGAGPNTKWDWQLVDGEGTVVKKGTAISASAGSGTSVHARPCRRASAPILAVNVAPSIGF